MTTTYIKAYEAYTNSDLTEGKGIDVHIGYFTNEIDAIKAAKGKGVMGLEAYTRYVDKTINIFDNLSEYYSTIDTKIMENIKSKLNSEEKRVLGL